MERLVKTIFVGTDLDCFEKESVWAVVHACKHPCFERALHNGAYCPGPQSKRLSRSWENDLYLNIVDGPMDCFRREVFSDFLDFATKHFEAGKKLLIHCNRGRSRAPSLALLFLAQHSFLKDTQTYRAAEQQFLKIHPSFLPGAGIRSFLIQNWDLLREARV